MTTGNAKGKDKDRRERRWSYAAVFAAWLFLAAVVALVALCAPPAAFGQDPPLAPKQSGDIPVNPVPHLVPSAYFVLGKPDTRDNPPTGDLRFFGGYRSSPAWGALLKAQLRQGTTNLAISEYKRLLESDPNMCDNCLVTGQLVKNKYLPADGWKITIPGADLGAQFVADAAQADSIRFLGADDGRWGEWIPLSLAASTIKQANAFRASGNRYDELHAAGYLRAAYDTEAPFADAVPGGEGGDGVVTGMPPPTETLAARLEMLPGGRYTAVFLVPMIAVGFGLLFSRSPVVLLLVCAGSMAVTVWLTGAPGWLFVMPALFGLGAALLGSQLGYTRKFGG